MYESIYQYCSWLKERGQVYPYVGKAPSPKEVKFIFLSEETLEANEVQMMEKIIKALNLDDKDVEILSSSQFDNSIENLYRSFSTMGLVLLGNLNLNEVDVENEFNRTNPKVKIILDTPTLNVFSPREMIDDSNKKRPTWEGLKDLVLKISLN